MSQPPQGQPPYGPDGQPPSGDRPTQGGGWGPPPNQPPNQPGQGWGQPGPPPGQGWGQPTGQPAPPPGQGWGQPTGQPGPPPGQGWGQPPSPSYGEQPTQVGGFSLPGQPPYAGGPGSPGGPGGWAPPGAPGAGDNKKRNLLITAVAALVLVIVVAVVLVVTLGGNDDEDGSTASGTSSSTSSSPTTSSSSSSAGSSPSGGLSPAPTGGAGTAGFIASLPADFTDCTEQELAGDGDVAAAMCGAAATQPGPQEAQFFLYPDTTTLDSVFQSDVSSQGLTEFPADESTDCTTTTGYGAWQYSDGTPGGAVACAITTDGHVIVSWTDDEFVTEGAVRSPGTTQEDVAALYGWWTQNSDFQG